MALENLMVDYGTNNYHSPEFLAVMEDHLTYLRTHEDTVVLSVSNDEAERWAGDLIGYLLTRNVDARLHYVTMRLSGMSSPTDFGVDITTISVSDPKVVNTIRKIENTRKNIRL